MQPAASDHGAVVMEAVEQASLGAPVESLSPVADELAQVGRVRSGFPAVRILVRGASPRESGGEVVEDWLGNEDLEWLGHGAEDGHASDLAQRRSPRTVAESR